VYLALPQRHRSPAQASKRSTVPGIANLVSGQLGPPESEPGFRHPVAQLTGVLMPETAVNEYDLAPSAENQVWATGQGANVKPIAEA
jgi:hypothetical protein